MTTGNKTPLALFEEFNAAAEGEPLGSVIAALKAEFIQCFRTAQEAGSEAAGYVADQVAELAQAMVQSVLTGAQLIAALPMTPEEAHARGLQVEEPPEETPEDDDEEPETQAPVAAPSRTLH